MKMKSPVAFLSVMLAGCAAKGPPPVGAEVRAALRRAVKHGDGYMGAGPTTTKNFAKGSPYLMIWV